MLKFVISLPDTSIKEVTLKEGLVIGRSKGDIIIPDKQISSTHAIVKTNKAGHFFLKDMSSSNGIINGGDRVLEVFLIPGVEFKIGSTLFKVLEVTLTAEEEEEINALDPQSYFKNLNFSDDNSSLDIQTFDQPVEMEFVRGPLNKISWKLYWGPIKIGTHPGSYAFLDQELENNLDLFEITKTSQDKAVFLRNLSNLKILINGSPAENKTLVEDGDLVELASSAFKIKFN